MPDNKKDPGPQDSKRVNIREDYEVRYWSKKFACTPEALKKAVEAE
jgi:hypothetical protein